VNPLVLVASIVGALGGLGGFAALVTAFARRRTITAEAEVRLSDAAREWVEQFQEDAKEARIEAREARGEAAAARREATEAHAQMRAVKTEAEWLARRLQELHRAILDPAASLERLRALVGTEPKNGTGR
jgi:uncharacterized protein (DUF3084 family)